MIDFALLFRIAYFSVILRKHSDEGALDSSVVALPQNDRVILSPT